MRCLGWDLYNDPPVGRYEGVGFQRVLGPGRGCDIVGPDSSVFGDGWRREKVV